MKRLILMYLTTAFCLSLGASQTHAQIFRRACPTGTCPNVVRYQRVYQPYSYQAAVRACEQVQTTVEAPEPCAPVEPIVEPCAPVANVVEPCAPCQSGEYVPTAEGNVCVNGTCPIRTAVKATTDAAVQTVRNVAAATRFLLAANRVRAQYNLPALKADENLDAGCESQAAYCSRVGQLVHGGNNAEILAYNYSGFDAAIAQWLNSPAHRSHLLSGNYRAAGVAVVRGNDGRIWCAMRFR